METVQLSLFQSAVVDELSALDTLDKFNAFAESLDWSRDIPSDLWNHYNGWRDWWLNWRDNPDAVMDITDAFMLFGGMGKVAYWTFHRTVRDRFEPVWFGHTHHYRFADLAGMAQAMGLKIGRYDASRNE